MADHIAREIANDVIGQMYFRCARQLYSSMTACDKAGVEVLKNVYYDTRPIPSAFKILILMVDTFDTEFGAVRIRDATILFRRWILAGLRYPRSDVVAKDVDLDVVHNAVFPD